MQQKMKRIEDERLHIAREIKKLNEKLENLTGTSQCLEDQQDASRRSSEEPVFDLETIKKRNGNVTLLPRYMRPTVCSRRKSGRIDQTSVGRDPIWLRRRPSSHRAESVTFPVKNKSEYASECSISKSTCVFDSDMKSCADNETEYSQDASEYDVKMMVFPEQETLGGTAIRQKTQLSHLEKNGSPRQSSFNPTKISKVDNWLNLHKNELPFGCYAPRSKRVLAIPIPEKKHRANGQNKADVLGDRKAFPCGFQTEKIIKYNFKERRVDIGEDGRYSMSEIVKKKPPMLRDIFVEESRSSFISLSHVMEDQTMLQPPDLLDSSFVKDNECGNPPDVKDTAQCSDSSMLKNSECKFSPSVLDNSIINSKDYFVVCTPVLDQERHCKEVHVELDIEESGKENKDTSSQSKSKETIPKPCRLRCQNVLYTDDTNQKDLTAVLVKSQGNTQNKGIGYILEQISCAAALLGLGFVDLGFDDNFFYGLML